MTRLFLCHQQGYSLGDNRRLRFATGERKPLNIGDYLRGQLEILLHHAAFLVAALLDFRTGLSHCFLRPFCYYRKRRGASTPPVCITKLAVPVTTR